jgi:hypothetical protein
MAQDDFFDLARLAKPQMMPNAPVGAGFGAGFDYGQQQQRQDGFIKGAAGLAELRAKMEAAKAEEESAGAPGRLADIGLKNKVSQDALDDADTTLQTAGQERKNKLDASRIKEMHQSIEKLDNYLNGWENLTDKEKAVRKKMVQADGATFGKTKLGDLSDEDFDQTMRALRKAQVQNPKYAEKQMEFDTKERIANANNATRTSLQKDKERLALSLKKLGIEAGDKRFNLDQYVAKLVAKRDGGDHLNEAQEDTLSYYARIKTFPSEVRAAGIKPTPTVENGRIVTKPAAVPPAPRLSDEQSQPQSAPAQEAPNAPPPAAAMKYKQAVMAAKGNAQAIAQINADWKKVFGDMPTPK